jgi:peptidyl-prolyl cis-trans isomerase C
MKRVAAKTNRFVSALLVCMLTFLMVVGLACRKKASTPEPSGPEPNAATPLQTPSATEAPGETAAGPPVEPSPVAVTVNGEPITEAQLNERIDYYMRSSPQMANLPPAFVGQVRAQVRTKALDDLVAQCLLNREVKAAGVAVTDEEALAAIKERVGAQNPPMTIEQLKEMLESRGGSLEQLKEQFKTGMALERFMEAKLAGKSDVTDDEARKYYDENPKRFDEPEQVQASHILIGFSGSADPNADPNAARAAAKAKAEDLLKQIKAGGDFAELAKANSTDPGSAPRGGDLGFFARGRMVPPFEEAAFALEPNAVSDLVETRYGYHIIKATGRKDARTVPFEEAKAGIVEQLQNQKRAQFVQEYIQSLKDQATIVYPPGSAPATGGPAPAPAASTLEPVTPATPAEPNTN